jgi:type I protein arginine methyltransferase
LLLQDNVYGFDFTPIKKVAQTEPVVDCIDAKQLVTDSVPILHLDLLTCSVSDLDFRAPFRLQAQRNDYIHALVAYFECAFTQIHKPLGFSTAPFARYTHWKQTIFYLPDPLTICGTEYLEGTIACRPNRTNRRDLDIHIQLDFRGRYCIMRDQSLKYRLR